MVETTKKIRFIWQDEEHDILTKLTIPPEIVERFYQGEALEFKFNRGDGRVRARLIPPYKGDGTIIIPR